MKYAGFAACLLVAAVLTIAELGFGLGFLHSGFKPGSPLFMKIVAPQWLVIWNPYYIAFLLYRASKFLEEP